MKITKFAITLALLLFIAPFVIYYINFSDMPILKDNSAWGSFGSYLSGSFSVVIAGLTLASLFVLLRTLKEAIEYNQRQITISQHESELNNFNFIISTITNNIKSSNHFTKKISGNTGGYYYEETNTSCLYNNFVDSYNFAKNNLKYPEFTNKKTMELLNIFCSELYDGVLQRDDINKCAKRFTSLFTLHELNSVYLLVKSLCDKIIKCTDIEQKELLTNIFTSSIDKNITYWSLAIINDSKYDDFMIPPEEMTDKLYEW
ncbi:hypothetical protein [Morganella morganii]|uniref:hypothetical protein n=1 Tax=Morganella morganii TaxID=582 RepID=UPI00280A0B8D|nr:hypothetical protein SUGSMm_07430 [Morganella morganii subsp. sibonii]HDU8308090.1 hypothetical protein [Morganella morganii subsp. sibonii]